MFHLFTFFFSLSLLSNYAQAADSTPSLGKRADQTSDESSPKLEKPGLSGQDNTNRNPPSLSPSVSTQEGEEKRDPSSEESLPKFSLSISQTPEKNSYQANQAKYSDHPSEMREEKSTEEDDDENIFSLWNEGDITTKQLIEEIKKIHEENSSDLCDQMTTYFQEHQDNDTHDFKKNLALCNIISLGQNDRVIRVDRDKLLSVFQNKRFPRDENESLNQ